MKSDVLTFGILGNWRTAARDGECVGGVQVVTERWMLMAEWKKKEAKEMTCREKRVFVERDWNPSLYRGRGYWKDIKDEIRNQGT